LAPPLIYTFTPVIRTYKLCPYTIGINYVVSRLNKLWETLERSTINTRLIEAIKSLYKGSSSNIKIGNPNTKGFKDTKGLRQGGCLSRTLFKI